MRRTNTLRSVTRIAIVATAFIIAIHMLKEAITNETKADIINTIAERGT